MQELSKEYKSFFDAIKSVIEKQKQQKMRGLNDYNILTTVLNAHDEVRLHSRMIASFLDTKGFHYQDSLFLDLFLKALGLNNFQLDTNSIMVQNEFHNIDIYITDGSRHMIIENKIYAGDQDKQIKRHIEKIQKLNPQIPSENILVIYLSIDRECPSRVSLDDIIISDKYLVNKDGERIALYANMHYKNEILEWLGKCKNEVQNITNLNEVFEQYMQVVKKITNQYKGKVMTLTDELREVISYYKIAREILENMPKMRDEVINNFFSEARNKLRLKLGKTWEVDIIGSFATRWEYPLRVYKKEWISNKNYLVFGFEFDKSSYYDGCFGVVKTNKNINIPDIAGEFAEELEKIDIGFNRSDWWLFNHLLPAKQDAEKDFVEEILFHKLTSDTFVEEVIVYLNKIELNGVLLLSKINERLAKGEFVRVC